MKVYRGGHIEEDGFVGSRYYGKVNFLGKIIELKDS